MISYLIVDDEYLAHDVIKEYCDLLPYMHLAKSCYNAMEAAEYLREHNVDLIFLDLNMPKLKGFEFLKTLTTPPKVIVTTAYSEFALEGYELNVIDYLLKPFSFERFMKAVNKVSSVTANPGSNVSVPVKGEASDNPGAIFLREDKNYIQVNINDILYLEASGNYTIVFTEESKIKTREKISDLLELLPEDNFIQVHRSFAVAIKHIDRVEGNLITIKKNEIPIGKVYKMNVKKLFE